MSLHGYLSGRLVAACSILLLLFIGGMAGESFSGVPAADVMHAFYLQNIPTSYSAQESMIASLQDAGANTVIVELPLNNQGLPDMGNVPNIVYLVHKIRLKVFVVLPLRRLPGALAIHRDWEDIRYDFVRDSTERTGMLDLFRTEVVLYLTEYSKRLASYSVDGIFLGPDFSYGPGEGMSDWALAKAKERLGEPVRPKKLFPRVVRGPEGVRVEEYSALFWGWAKMKRDRLLQVYDAVAAAGRSVRPSLQFGIPAPVILPVTDAREVLALYSYDMGAFRQRSVNYYWTQIDVHERKERQELTYRQALEIVSRAAFATATAVKELEKRVIVLEAASADGRVLPFSEIEEVSELVRNTGQTGIAYRITAATVVPQAFMQKMFEK